MANILQAWLQCRSKPFHNATLHTHCILQQRRGKAGGGCGGVEGRGHRAAASQSTVPPCTHTKCCSTCGSPGRGGGGEEGFCRGPRWGVGGGGGRRGPGDEPPWCTSLQSNALSVHIQTFSIADCNREIMTTWYGLSSLSLQVAMRSSSSE